VTAPEEQARQTIDALLAAAGWSVQDFKQADIHAARGVAIREFPLSSPSPLSRGADHVPQILLDTARRFS
jgi:type I site-specific restriction endonuclease